MKWKGEWVHPHGDYSLKARYKFGVKDWLIVASVWIVAIAFCIFSFLADKIRFNFGC